MRIGIVNDQPLAVEALRRTLTGGPAPRHRLAWVAGDGAQAVQRCSEDRPDLVLMDLVMPGMDGVEATRRIMEKTPCAILLVTANARALPGKVFEAMGAGALDVVAPPTPDVVPADFLAKIETMSRLVGAEARLKTFGGKEKFPVATATRLVAIGSSAGGPAALAAVLGALPAKFPAAVVIVQHLDAKFADGLAAWLNDQSPLPVRLARTGDAPQRSTVLLAGAGDHLVFTGPVSLGYTAQPAECAYRPSVDVFFESAARHWRNPLLGVLLTGMGRDGAKGLKTLRAKGCHTVAQDQATSAIYGMPKHAAAIGAAAEILPLDLIAVAMQRFAATVA